MRDITLEDTIFMDFTTRSFSTGVPTVLSGTPVLSVLEENNATPITAGVSVSVDRASVVGLNMATVIATAANGYENSKGYSLYISTGTVGGVSVIGEKVGEFTIGASAAAVDLANGTDGLGALSTDIGTAQADLDIITGAAGALLDTTATSAQLVDDVWDEVLSGATHNVAQSSGRRLRALSGLILAEGTAQSGGANTIQLASGDVTIDEQFARSKVILTAGTGAGQEAIISSSVESTDTLTVTPSWLINPDATTAYEVLPAQVHTSTQNGGYESASVWYDSISGTAGTEKFVNATSTNPSNTIADLRTVADLLNLRRIMILPGSLLTLDQAYTNFQFGGEGGFITLGGRDISGSTFARQGVTGTQAASTANVTYNQCGMIGPITTQSTILVDCASITLGGDYNFVAGENYIWDHCSQGDGGAPSVINVNGDGILTTKVLITDYEGDLLVKGLTATDIFTFTGKGNIEFDSSNVGGTISLAGIVSLTDNSTGTTITQVPRLDILRILSDSTAFAGADIASILTDTVDIQTRLPAALISGRMDSDVEAVNDKTASAVRLGLSAGTILVATAQTGTLTTTVMTSSLTETTDDHFNGRIIIWTSGVLTDQATDITDYSGTNGTLTFTAVTEAPSNGDTFIIV